MARFLKFLDELRRRRVIKVAVMYIVAAWLLLQVADLAFESWGIPAGGLRYIWLGALISFPLVIIFSWIYDVSDGAIVRTSDSQTRERMDLSLGRRDHLLLGAMFIALVAVVFWAGNQIRLGIPEGAKDRAEISVSTWPEADLLFRQNPYWRGGDTSDSTDLGDGRVLWLFGDSFVAAAPGQDRARSDWIRNCVAIQRGYDPPSATLEFFWQTGDSRPTSYFKDNQDSWYWPHSAVLIDQSLLIFLIETKETNVGLGFEHINMAVVAVENPEDAPDRWRLRDLVVPQNDFGIFLGMSETIRIGDHVYAFSKQEPSNDVYLARWSAETLSSGSLENIEWWSGDIEKWVPTEEFNGIGRPVFSATPTNFSIHYDSNIEKFVQLQTWGFGSAVVAIRTAAELTGPWSDRRIIYRPGESDRSDALIYGGKGHDHLMGADIVATYNVNSEVFSELLRDQTIYYPKFIRIDIAQ